MRVLLPVLLFVLLCVEPGLSLSCYNCTGAQQSSQCNSVLCLESETYCGSLEVRGKTGPENAKLYFKGCTRNSCENFFQELLRRASKEISQPHSEVGYVCCTKELCNGADLIRGSPLVLTGAILLCLGSSFFWISL